MPNPILFAVGITGHRLNRLPEAGRAHVRAEIGRLLQSIAAEARRAPEPVGLVLVSSLAEGADRIAAQEALERGFALHAILPFAAQEYERDFAQTQSKMAFHALLAAAAEVKVLPFDGKDREAGYEAAGLAMLDAAHIVIAVWDGGPSGGRGGTTEMVTFAAKRGRPVLWVDPAAGRPTALYEGGTAAQGIAKAMAACRRGAIS